MIGSVLHNFLDEGQPTGLPLPYTVNRDGDEAVDCHLLASSEGTFPAHLEKVLALMSPQPKLPETESCRVMGDRRLRQLPFGPWMPPVQSFLNAGCFNTTKKC